MINKSKKDDYSVYHFVSTPGLKIIFKTGKYMLISTLQRGQPISYKNSMQNNYFKIKLKLINK